MCSAGLGASDTSAFTVIGGCSGAGAGAEGGGDAAGDAAAAAAGGDEGGGASVAGGASCTGALGASVAGCSSDMLAADASLSRNTLESYSWTFITRERRRSTLGRRTDGRTGGWVSESGRIAGYTPG